MATNTELKYKILGFDDDATDCEVCGKRELKGTYAIEDLSSGIVFRAGSTCGARMAGWTTKELVIRYKEGEKQKRQDATREYRESPEYVAYHIENEKINKENDDIERRIWKETDREKRNLIYSERLTPIQRSERTRPLFHAMHEKQREIIAKYGLPEKTYLG